MFFDDDAAFGDPSREALFTQQSVDDIEALLVEEDMPELQRFLVLLDRGVFVQRISVVENLPKLVTNHGKCVEAYPMSMSM